MENNMKDFMNLLNLLKYAINQETFIEQISNHLSSNIDLFNIDYDRMNRTFTLKIKKTVIKKRYPDYSTDSIFYYNIINGILFSFITSNYNQLENEIIKLNPTYVPNSLLQLINIEYMSFLYTITSFDNIVIIHL